MGQEICVQCGVGASQHPVAIVMNVVDVDKLHDAGHKIDVIGNSGVWMTLPVCGSCHRSPKLKGHYFPRAGAHIGLANAGSENLG